MSSTNMRQVSKGWVAAKGANMISERVRDCEGTRIPNNSIGAFCNDHIMLSAVPGD